jgi:transposase-like protein/nucleotide-binding universal stress UspA family protein
MAHYRRSTLDLSTRLEIATMMLLPRPYRAWGKVAEIARRYRVSRTLLYRWRDKAQQALQAVLAPQKPGPKPHQETLSVDRDVIRYAVTVLALHKGSVRDIQRALALLFGVRRSVGFISQTLQASGQRAQAYQAQSAFPLPLLGEADEIFQGGRPWLTVVDGRAFLVLHLAPAQARDATTWGLVLLDLEERGVQFRDLASDGARGIRAGVREAGLAIPLRPDLFHLLRDAHRVSQTLERQAYRAIREAERARRAEREARAPKRRRGRPLKVTVPLPQAEAQEQQAMARYDAWTWLLQEVRQALEPLTPEGRLQSATQARATLETAVELMEDLGHKAVTAFAHHLKAHLDELLAPLAWLENQLVPWREKVDAATQAFIGWAWQHREALDVDIRRDFSPDLQPVVEAFWQVMGLFHRASSLAEALHSWLRPYFHIHRGLPAWLGPLLQLFWNHHRFQRGKRAGHTPLELAGVEKVPALAEVLAWISGAQAAPMAL